MWCTNYPFYNNVCYTIHSTTILLYQLPILQQCLLYYPFYYNIVIPTTLSTTIFVIPTTRSTTIFVSSTIVTTRSTTIFVLPTSNYPFYYNICYTNYPFRYLSEYYLSGSSTRGFNGVFWRRGLHSLERDP